MLASFESRLKGGVKRGLARYGITIARHDWTKVENFIPFKETLAKAEAEGMQVGDWIDAKLSKTPGASQDTIDRMAKAGVFANVHNVVEIGPGSGRYLYRTIALSRPERYEVYETAPEWASWLARSYPIIVQPTNGTSMSSTADASVELAQAHKVFSTIPFIATCGYWVELVRVTKPGSFIVFDCMTEACLSPERIVALAGAGITTASFPAVMPRCVILEFFSSHGCRLIDQFCAPMPPASTEVFIFKR